MDAINICAPNRLDWYDSYGIVAGQLARHMAALGVYVNLFALGERECDNQPPDLQRIVAQPVRPASTSVMLGYPTNYEAHGKAGRRVAITMFESSRLPQGWAKALNTMDAVIVPSRFCYNTFRLCGVRPPMHVVPLGVGEFCKPAQRSSDGPFTFLAFLDRGQRKGGLVALQAFVRAFGDDPDYRLILKGRAASRPMGITNPNVEVIQQDMTDEELYQLYLSAHALVNPNKGEGFGIIPRQHAATGGVSLSTGWGGTADDIDVWGIPIPYKLVKADWAGARNLAGQNLGKWAEISSLELAALMRYVALERERLLQRAYVMADKVRRMYDWRKFAERVLEVCEGVRDANISGAKVAA